MLSRTSPAHVRYPHAAPEALRPLTLVRRRATPGDAPLIKQRRYYLYSFDPDAGWSPNAAVPCVDFERGQLFVNGVQIVTPRITDDHVTWLQHAKDSNGTHYLAGHLHLHSNGLEAHGAVVTGTNQRDAVSHDVMATAIPSVKYQTKITSERYPAGTDPVSLPESAWKAGLPLEVGYRQEVGNDVPTPVVNLGDQDISDQCSWSVDDSHTVLNIDLDATYCDFAPELYAQAKLSFDALKLNAPGVGVVRNTCSDLAGSDAAESDGTARLWQATVKRPPAAQTAPMVRLLPHPQRQAVTQAQLLSTADDGLKVEELITLLPDDLVNDDANSMLMRNMKWAMGQDRTQKDWLAKFFGETPPVITEPNQQALVKQGLGWYQKKFAMAYLTQSFNTYDGPNQPVHRLNTDQATTLSDFLKSGLAKDKDFNVQHQGIYIDAYVGVQGRLRNYINDTTPEYVGWATGKVVFSRKDASQELKVPKGVIVQTASGTEFTTQDSVTLPQGTTDSGEVVIVANKPGRDGIVDANTITQFGYQPANGTDSVSNPAATQLEPDSGGMKWAKKLYAELTTGAQFILMVNRIAGVEGDPKAMGPASNFACLLTALDRTGKTAANYFQSLISGMVIKQWPKVVHRDKETIMQWLPATMEELLRRLANGESLPLVEITAEEAEEMFQEFTQHSAAICDAMADLLLSISAVGLVKQVNDAEEKAAETLATRWPKLAKASSVFVVLGFVGGLAMVIASLVTGGWKKMTDVERVDFVTRCVQLVVTGLGPIRALTLSAWNTFTDWLRGPVQQEQVQAQGESLLVDSDDEGALVRAEAETTNELIEGSEAAGTAIGAGTVFERLFAQGVFAGVLKIFGAITAVAFACWSGWQLYNDIVNHGSVTTIVFDSLIFAANAVAAICLVISLFSASTVVPIVGAVAAIIGVIITVIAYFVVKPKNPVDEWMVDHGIPFVKGLPPQQKSPPAVARLEIVMA